MPAPVKHPSIRIAQALLVLAALALVLNPELRALLLLASAIGLDIVVVLLAVQLRVLFALGAPRSRRLFATVCSLASRVGYLALLAYPMAASFRVLERILCPVLITVSYALSCQKAVDQWRGP